MSLTHCRCPTQTVPVAGSAVARQAHTLAAPLHATPTRQRRTGQRKRKHSASPPVVADAPAPTGSPQQPSPSPAASAQPPESDAEATARLPEATARSSAAQLSEAPGQPPAAVAMPVRQSKRARGMSPAISSGEQPTDPEPQPAADEAEAAPSQEEVVQGIMAEAAPVDASVSQQAAAAADVEAVDQPAAVQERLPPPVKRRRSTLGAPSSPVTLRSVESAHLNSQGQGACLDKRVHGCAVTNRVSAASGRCQQVACSNWSHSCTADCCCIHHLLRSAAYILLGSACLIY